MRYPDRKLARLFARARQAEPRPLPAVSRGEIEAFAARTAARWAEADGRSAQSHALWLWERVGAWSLGAATAALALALWLRPVPPQKNPFEPFLQEPTAPAPFFGNAL